VQFRQLAESASGPSRDRQRIRYDGERGQASLLPIRQRYQTLLPEEISHTVAMPSDIEDELRHLIAVLRA